MKTTVNIYWKINGEIPLKDTELRVIAKKYRAKWLGQGVNFPEKMRDVSFQLKSRKAAERFKAELEKFKWISEIEILDAEEQK